MRDGPERRSPFTQLRKHIMFDKDAIKALQESASIAAAMATLESSSDTKNTVALPSDYKLHDLEKLLPLRRRARGTMTTTVLKSFLDYTKDHAEPGASVFVEAQMMGATSVLNLGTPDEPGQADNKAKLSLTRTAAFSALLGVANSAALKQATVAEFLEDWANEITCMNDAGEIATTKAIAAIRKLTIETMRKLESEEQSLSASRSAFESVQATSKEPIPTTIRFECQPYSELLPRTFALRLAIQTGGDKPTISLRIVKAEQHNEEMAQELVELIADQFAGDVPVLIGAYAKGE